MRKIAIIGSAEGNKHNAPKGYEWWSMNNLYVTYNKRGLKHFARWFELHDFKRTSNKHYTRRSLPSYNGKMINQYMQELANLNIPVYMQKKWKIIPKSKVFPFEQIMSQFATQYFGCSFAWMTALALYEHIQGDTIDTIGYYGVELQGIEYYYQLPSTLYFMGLAKGMGINIDIPEQSGLMKSPWIYAYKEDYRVIDYLFADKGKYIGNIIMLIYQQLNDYWFYGEK